MQRQIILFVISFLLRRVHLNAATTLFDRRNLIEEPHLGTKYKTSIYTTKNLYFLKLYFNENKYLF